MKRVEFLKDKWASQVAAQAAKLDHSMPSDAVPFELLLSADPTPKKLYSEFVMRTYCAGEYLAEDIGRLHDTLAAFHSAKRRLPLDRRDIGVYGSERDLWTTLVEAGHGPDEETSGKQAKRSDRNRAHLESEVVTSEGWTMVTLASAFAARWWGMGTRWCTTEKTGKTYLSYAHGGKLRVFVSPSGVKHQLHVATGSLCDALDHRVSVSAYLRGLPKAFVPAIKSDFEAYTSQLAGVESETSHRGFRHRFNTILSLPAEFFGETVANSIKALAQAGIDGLKELQSESGWRVRVSKNDLSSWAVRHVHDEPHDETNSFSSAYMIEAPDGRSAVYDTSPSALRKLAALVPDMPTALREDILMRCVKDWQGWKSLTGVEIDHILSTFPTSELSHTFWRTWAKKMALNDQHFLTQGHRREDLFRFGTFPDEAMNEEIALVFAKQGVRDRIPDRFLSRQIATTLAKADAAFLEDPSISGLLGQRDLADVYGGNNGLHIELMPLSMRTAEMARMIVEVKTGALKRLIPMIRRGDFDLGTNEPEVFVTEITMTALDHTPTSLIAVDIPLSRDIYLEAVKRDAGMLSWVPLEYRDVEMCLATVSDGQNHGLCHFPAWVVDRIRADNDGAHGITHNYRPSAKYAPTLLAFRMPEGGTPEALLPFSTDAVAVPVEKRYPR